jgi:hypothetical protein
MYVVHGLGVLTMLTSSHDLRRRFCNCRCYHRIERRIGPRNMYRRFRCCRNCPWFPISERPNTRQDLMAGLDRTVSILAAIFTVTISVGVQDRPALAPKTGPWETGFQVIGHPSFTEASSAISALILAYAGTPT